MKKLSKSPFIFMSLLGIILSFGFASYSFAAIDEPDNDIGSIGNIGSSIKMVGYVIFCLILIIALFFVIIKVISQKNKLMMSGRSVKLIGGVAIGQNKTIQVVEVGHTLYVVGVGENVQLISKVEDAEEIEFIINNMQIRGNMDFPSLGKWFKGLKGEKHIEEEDLSPSFQQVFHEKMERISNRKQRVDELLHNDNESDRLNDK
ncbi:flagellar protein [Paenibacillus psychroresistens]|uniref:Flagellar protein n=1 Tax=Paenibacillus psychroresistens TaxID=1778678 RepID=A0A6B8RKW0_9BACL|nr:flagellar biosynthetic protein FliO [Paenibacillus psychroresistens]QGQ96242.1 flagellar protein [Paenibacillus psychroresistens]